MQTKKKEKMRKKTIIEKIRECFGWEIDLEDLETLEEEEHINISLYVKIKGNKRLYKIR